MESAVKLTVKSARWLQVCVWWIVGLVVAAGMVETLMSPNHVRAAGDLTLYGDALADEWQDWSWDTTVANAGTPVHSGSASLAVTHNAGWAGLSLRAPAPLNAAEYQAINFWVYGAPGGTQIALYIHETDSGPVGTGYAFTAPGGMWTEHTVSLAQLGNPAQIARVTWQENTGSAAATYYLDDIRVLAANGTGPTPPTPGGGRIQLNVDAAANRKPISPYIYGMNQYGMGNDSVQLMEELGVSVRRWGGNATSRYNYQNDISNHASDWYFGNVKQSNATNLPEDSAVNRVINQNRQAGAETLLVLPMSGYVANNDPTACGFSVAKYGAQQATAVQDSRPDCGNGVRPNGTLITGNDPLDTSIAIDPSFVAGWVNALEAWYGPSGNGGVRFYNLDNEPDIWFETHRDIQPIGWKYTEFRDRTYQYAAAIKAADPTAKLLGPVSMGWTYYWHSPYDGQRQDWATPDDRNANGGVPFVPWYLQQMAAYEEEHGTRLLDYLDLHYYPQAPGVALQPAGNAATQARRLRSTRSLWDPTYVDESWIRDAGPDDGIIRLIPRMREWVAQNYPGTKLAIGEYNWGALDHINGALAQADVLGIFGREGLDLATLWQPPGRMEPGAFAFRMYRNYDGNGAAFGETSVSAASSDQEQLSIYAAQRQADGALTLMIINKSTGARTADLEIKNFNAQGTAQVYRYSAADLTAIRRGADRSFTANGTTATLTMEFPASSITLLVLPLRVTGGQPGQPVDDVRPRIYLPKVDRQE